MDNYKAPLAAAARARKSTRDLELAVTDAALHKDDWTGDVSDVGNYSNWRTAANAQLFTSDAAFAAEDFAYIEKAEEDVLLRELSGSYLGDSMFIGEEFHDGMFNIFDDEDDDDSWDAEEWDSGEQDYY